MDRVGLSMMLLDLSFAASRGRVSRGDLADARHRLAAGMREADPEACAMFERYLDRLEEAAGDAHRLADIGAELRAALRTWHRPDPVDIDRRDIHG